VEGLNWPWVALMSTAPAIVAVLVAIPFWRHGAMIFGNIVGTAVIFGTAMGLILREHAELDRATEACLAVGNTCWPDPSAFARYAIYSSIGLVEVVALFCLSLAVEKRMRGRDYAPEWRR
jgi:hypothetical protein